MITQLPASQDPTIVLDDADRAPDDHPDANHAADHAPEDHANDDKPGVLIVDHDPATREALAAFLVGHGLRAEAIDGGAALRLRLAERACDLVMLDMMIPGEDGFSLLRELTRAQDVPGVIVFSDRDNEVDRIVALELGADDYVTKPSNPREILARIRSVLRRRSAAARPLGDPPAPPPPAPPVPRVDSFSFAGWTFNSRMRTLHAPGGAPLRLTSGEFALLNVFVRQPQTVHSRDAMIEHAGRTGSTTRARTIDVNISRLRRKLQSLDDAEIIRTVRGNGYVFLPDVTAT